MLVKIVIIALLLYIIVNLFRAGLVMLKPPQPGVNMSRYLGRRVLFSVLVLVFIFIAMALGLLHPNPRPY